MGKKKRGSYGAREDLLEVLHEVKEQALRRAVLRRRKANVKVLK